MAIWKPRPNKHLEVLKNKRQMLFYGLGGACKLSIHWRELKVPSVVTFHWLSYGSLPLAELLLGREEPVLRTR